MELNLLFLSNNEIEINKEKIATWGNKLDDDMEMHHRKLNDELMVVV